MHDSALRQWLLSDQPDPAPELRALLAESPLPPRLAESTLSRVEGEWDKATLQTPRRIWAATGLALAASVLVWIQAPPSNDTLDPTSHMVAKGLEETAPALSLKMAVQQGESVSRHAVGTQYSAGDSLFFRASLSESGWVHLVHATSGVTLVASQQMDAGEQDLGSENSVHAWSLEASDTRGVFALVGHRSSLSEATLVEALSGDPSTLCQRARAQGWSCDARMVEVAP